MFPWLQSNFHFPLSGDVNQKVEPDFFTFIDTESGDSELEREIFSKVGSYGTQLSLLTKVVLSLAKMGELTELDEESQENYENALDALEQQQKRIDEIKQAKKQRIKEKATDILDKLQASDSDEFDQLLRKYGYNRTKN
ncbi:hypothetical protein [Vibrio mangrovi]|uniref:Uncharacterized protein n=1 Tax=Vibrio mangrovi TaxID=474394 RepID=A0A1Y6IX26_9VIBR|nr:hypothetical protein [Vibrio mangrovi]MDW6005356.1 hypothetical protein [Vibrio mangrovi]SMS02204.1 hypothetical protein VIM7927_03522 [Vibrio mangrovi]